MTWKFCNKDFNDFCRKQGIERHRVVVNTPQQNDVVERMNKTLLEIGRCILVTSKLPKFFWGGVFYTTAYLINRSPSSAICFKRLEEKWTGRKSSLDHWRVCGCEAFAYKVEVKLHPRVVRCVFLWYQEGTKG